MRKLADRRSSIVCCVLALVGVIAFAIVFWIRSPLATANKIAAAISTKNMAAVQALLGKEAADSIRSSYTQIQGKPFTVYVNPDQRSLTKVFAGEQGFLITGYGGAHRFHVARGQVSNFRYTFISGVEYTR